MLLKWEYSGVEFKGGQINLQSMKGKNEQKSRTIDSAALFQNSEQNPESNPRRAATKLKEMQLHIEMMKNRFKVIEGHDQYQRYKTIDQEKRIEQHNSIHQRISKEKELLRKSIEKIHETAQMREKNEALRKEIRDSIREARKSVLQIRTERFQKMSEEEVENQKRIKEFKERELEQNKEKKKSVLVEQQKKRKMVKRYQQNKIKHTILNKSKDSNTLRNQTDNLSKEYNKMMEIERSMMEDNNRSLEASRMMKIKFRSLIPQGGKRNQSSKLPELSPRDANGKKTANSQPLAP